MSRFVERHLNTRGEPPASGVASHVIATTAGLGPDHTTSGLTAGQFLRATSASTAAFQVILAGDLPAITHASTTGQTPNDHHNQSHVLATGTALGPDHTMSGAAAGEVLRALGATTAAFDVLQHSDLGGVTSDQHHAQVHVLATGTALGPAHTRSGAAGGEVLRALGATSAAFDVLQHSDLGGVSSDQHHAQSHGIATTAGLGADHTTSGLTIGQVLRATGATAAAFQALVAADIPLISHDTGLTGVSPDDHHNQVHVLATGTALGPDHTMSGAAAGDVLRALSATTAAFDVLQHGDLGGAAADDHHNQVHVLATGTALGPDHTMSGAAAGEVLRALGATTAAFDVLQHADLGGVTSDQHHAQIHVLATDVALGPDHTISGAASGDVLRASSATTANFVELFHGDLAVVTPDQHHNQSHVLATGTALGPDHTMSGAAAGEVLRALGATSAAFDVLQHSDLGGVTSDQHHAQSHVIATTAGLGADHTTSGLTIGQVLRATGTTAAAFQSLIAADIPQLAHSSLSGLTTGDDHTQYLFLAGRAGGQIQFGGTALTEDLDLRSANITNARGSIELGNVGPVLGAAAWDVIRVASSGASIGLAVRLNLLRFDGTTTQTTDTFVGFPFIQLFVDSGTQTLASTFTAASLITSFFSTPLIQNTQTVNWTVFGSTGLLFLPRTGRTSSGTMAGGVFAAVDVRPPNAFAQTGITVAHLYGLRMVNGGPVGGTWTEHVGVQVENLTRATLNLSLRSLGAAVQMRHAGPGVFGANAATTNLFVALEVQSTTKAFLLPRMTTTQRNVMTAVNGMVIYNTTTAVVEAREGGAWVNL